MITKSATTPPRVLMAADISSQRDTGLGRHQWYLARELERTGFHVRAFYAEDAARYSGSPARRFYFPAAVLGETLAAQRHKRAYDAVVVHEGCASAVCLGRKLGLHRAACIVVSHNPEQKVWDRNCELARAGLHTIPMRTRLLWPLTRLSQSNFALRAADVAACLSEEDCAFLRAGLKVPQARIRLLSNGVDESFLVSGSKPAEPRILFLGSWLPLKGIRDFATAAAQVLKACPAAKICVAGTGCGESQVRQSFAEDIAESLEVLPYVSPAQLTNLYARHNIFVLPSWYEGMPLSLLEAMAAGLAPVVTNVGGMRDVIRDGVDGRVAPMRDAARLAQVLLELCANHEMRARIGAAATERARHYTWKRAGELLASVVLHSLEQNGYAFDSAGAALPTRNL